MLTEVELSCTDSLPSWDGARLKPQVRNGVQPWWHVVASSFKSSLSGGWKQQLTWAILSGFLNTGPHACFLLGKKKMFLFSHPWVQIHHSLSDGFCVFPPECLSFFFLCLSLSFTWLIPKSHLVFHYVCSAISLDRCGPPWSDIPISLRVEPFPQPFQTFSWILLCSWNSALEIWNQMTFFILSSCSSILVFYRL